MKKCRVKNCEEKPIGRKLCSRHYSRFLYRIKNNIKTPLHIVHKIDDSLVCKKCELKKELHEFTTFKSRKDIKRRSGWCKKCKNDYQIKYCKKNFKKVMQWRKKYNAQNRPRKRARDDKQRRESKAIVNKIKSETPCSDCSKFFHPVAMDFDHIKKKNFSVASMVSSGYKPDLILKEIELCEVVCACCHRLRTHNRKQNNSKAFKFE